MFLAAYILSLKVSKHVKLPFVTIPHWFYVDSSCQRTWLNLPWEGLCPWRQAMLRVDWPAAGCLTAVGLGLAEETLSSRCTICWCQQTRMGMCHPCLCSLSLNSSRPTLSVCREEKLSFPGSPSHLRNPVYKAVYGFTGFASTESAFSLCNKVSLRHPTEAASWWFSPCSCSSVQFLFYILPSYM